MKAAFRRLERSVNNLLARIVVTGLNTASKCQMLQVSILADEQKENVEHLEPYGFTSAPLTGAEGFALFPDGDRSHGVILMVSDRRYRIKGLQGGEVCLFTDEGDTLTFKRGNTVELKTKQFLVDAEDLIKMTTKQIQFTASESAQIDTPKLTANATTYTQVSTTATFNCDTTVFNGQNWNVTAATEAQINSATIDLIAASRIDQTAPEIGLNGNLTVSDVSGGAAASSVMRGNFRLEGNQSITGTSEAVDHLSSGKSGATHQHPGDSGGETGEPI
ncbi:TPA: phage baseplate assembly protein V [Salmonella enterica]